MKTRLTFSILIGLLAYLPANARPTEDPAKNYLSIHVGLWPVDYNLYEYDAVGQGSIRDSYRYFGPAIEAAYGRRINDFLALEGRGFLALITGSDISPDVSLSNYRSTRYGVSAGAVVTPLGRLFRFAQVGVLLGYSREDTRETLRHTTGYITTPKAITVSRSAIPCVCSLGTTAVFPWVRKPICRPSSTGATITCVRCIIRYCFVTNSDRSSGDEKAGLSARFEHFIGHNANL